VTIVSLSELVNEGQLKKPHSQSAFVCVSLSELVNEGQLKKPHSQSAFVCLSALLLFLSNPCVSQASAKRPACTLSSRFSRKDFCTHNRKK